MSLTLSLTSSLKKQSPSLGTDPLPVPYSIILYIQHMYSTYVGYIWSGLRSPAVLGLFKGGKLKQARFHVSTWISNTCLFELQDLIPSFQWWLCAQLRIHPYLYWLHSKASGKTVIFSLYSFSVLFCQKIQLSLTSNMEIFSDLSLLAMCRWDSLTLYFPERLLMCITLLIVNVNFLVAV